MNFTEVMLSNIVKKIKGDYKFKIMNDENKEIEIDFSTPWKRISVMEELEKLTNEKFPEDFESEESNKFFDELCKKHNIECSHPRNSSRLVDKLIGHFIEPNCYNPTFLIEHPQIMCPLAKYHRSKKGLTERFELFINQHEYVNAYTELNDPFV